MERTELVRSGSRADMGTVADRGAAAGTSEQSVNSHGNEDESEAGSRHTDLTGWGPTEAAYESPQEESVRIGSPEPPREEVEAVWAEQPRPEPVRIDGRKWNFAY